MIPLAGFWFIPGLAPSKESERRTLNSARAVCAVRFRCVPKPALCRESGLLSAETDSDETRVDLSPTWGSDSVKSCFRSISSSGNEFLTPELWLVGSAPELVSGPGVGVSFATASLPSGSSAVTWGVAGGVSWLSNNPEADGLGDRL